MKPFNLDEYLKNPDRKVITRDGRKVRRILCTDARGEYPVVALVEHYDNTSDNAYSYTKDGSYYHNAQGDEDLFFAPEAPEKYERWVNVYKRGSKDYSMGAETYICKKHAEVAAGRNCIATVKIEWEE